VPFTIEVTTAPDQSISLCGGASVSSVQQILLDTFADDLSQASITVTAELLKAKLLCAGIAVETFTMNGGLDEVVLGVGEIATLIQSDITVTIGGDDANNNL